MKAIIASLVLAFAPAAALAATPPELIGDWKGTIDSPAGKLTIVFHVGADRVTADSPDQGALNLPATAGSNGSNLTLDLPIVGANFEGKLAPDGKTLPGTFHQGGGSVALTLTQTSKTPTLPPLPKAAPAEIKGEWKTDVPTPNGPVTIAYHLTDNPTADIGPAKGVPALIDKTADGFKIDVMGAVFAGKLAADGKTMAGIITQGGQGGPVTLTRQ